MPAHVQSVKGVLCEKGNRKAQRDAPNRSCACLTGCDGCPFVGKSCAASKKS